MLRRLALHVAMRRVATMRVAHCNGARCRHRARAACGSAGAPLRNTAAARPCARRAGVPQSGLGTPRRGASSARTGAPASLVCVRGGALRVQALAAAKMRISDVRARSLPSLTPSPPFPLLVRMFPSLPSVASSLDRSPRLPSPHSPLPEGRTRAAAHRAVPRGAAQVDVIALHDCYASNELLL